MATVRPEAGEETFLARPALGPRMAERLRAHIASLPAWAWLGGIVAASVLIEIAAGRRIQSPLVFDDELISWELARNFAAGGHFVIREASTSVYGPVTRLYPALIAPAFPLSGNLTRAYVTVKEINAALMSLAAIPVFFIARNVLSRTMALVAAALAVAVPSLVYTGMVMTENAAYPAFLLCALAIIRALERPTVGRQSVVLATIILAFVIRAQAIGLVPAYVCAIFLLAWLESERGSRLRALRAAFVSYRTSWLALLVGGAAILGALLMRGDSPSALLGSYSAVGGGTHVMSIPRWFLYQLADLDLYVGVAPFAACCVLLPLALRGLRGRPLRVFAVASVSIIAWLMVTVAQVSSTVWGLGRLHERNLFYVVPLILIGFLAFFEIDLPRWQRLKVIAVVIAAGLPATLPFERLIRGALVDTLALLPWANTLIGGRTVPLAMTVLASLLALLILFPRRVAPIAILVVAVNFSVIGFVARADAQAASRTLARVRINQQWIDQAVGPNVSVVAVWFPSSLVCMTPAQWNIRAYGFWENEFFNRTVRRTFYVRRRLDNLPAQRLTLASGTAVLTRLDGRSFSPRYVVVGDGVHLDAQVVARDAQTRTVLYRVRGDAQVIPSRRCPALAGASGTG